jgi:hypothetical protein
MGIGDLYILKVGTVVTRKCRYYDTEVTEVQKAVVLIEGGTAMMMTRKHRNR